MHRADADKAAQRAKLTVTTTDRKQGPGGASALLPAADDPSPKPTGEPASNDDSDDGDDKREAAHAATTASSGVGSPTFAPKPRPSSDLVSPELLAALRQVVKEELAEQLHKSGGKDRFRDELLRQHDGLDVKWGTSTLQPSSALSAVDTSHPRVPDAETTGSTASPTGHRLSLPLFPHQRQAVEAANTRSPSTSRATHPQRQTGPAVEISAIDQKWGLLFDSAGHPSKRLEEILSDLANHIVHEFPPLKGLVVTPDKLATFYSDYRLEHERFPFANLFASRDGDIYDRIADLYHDLGLEYHLVQANPKTRPNVPGLTPAGFAQWVITNILAYPDEEAGRFGRVVSALPINADSPLDGKPERLPKQISRHLLPEKPDRKTQRLLDEAMSDLLEEIPPFPAGPSGSLPRPIHGPATKNIPSPMTSPRSRYEPSSGDGFRDPHRLSFSRDRPSTTLREVYPKTGDGGTASSPRLGRAYSTGSPRMQVPPPPHIPPPPIGRTPSTKRNRSPRAGGFRTSNPEIHNQGHHPGQLSSPPSSFGSAHAVELATVRERDTRDQEYHVYASPRDSRSSIDETPRPFWPAVANPPPPRDTEAHGRRDRSPNPQKVPPSPVADRGETWGQFLDSKPAGGTRARSRDHR